MDDFDNRPQVKTVISTIYTVHDCQRSATSLQNVTALQVIAFVLSSVR
jgi:hypothetical protein